MDCTLPSLFLRCTLEGYVPWKLERIWTGLLSFHLFVRIVPPKIYLTKGTP